MGLPFLGVDTQATLGDIVRRKKDLSQGLLLTCPSAPRRYTPANAYDAWKPSD